MARNLPELTKSEIEEMPGDELVELLIDEVGKGGKADEIIDEALQVAKTISGDYTRADTLSDVAEIMAENEQEQRANEI